MRRQSEVGERTIGSQRVRPIALCAQVVRFLLFRSTRFGGRQQTESAAAAAATASLSALPQAKAARETIAGGLSAN